MATKKIIHVAGTNGKGSVCAYLRAVMMEAGISCGMFISPHLVTMRERFVTQEGIADEEVEPQDYDRPEDPGWERPRRFIALGYTVTPDIPQEAFSVRDCAPADPARRKPGAPGDPLGSGFAVFFTGRDGKEIRWAASSMRFTPPERVTWRIWFHLVSRGEVTVELPGEK